MLGGVRDREKGQGGLPEEQPTREEWIEHVKGEGAEGG